MGEAWLPPFFRARFWVQEPTTLRKGGEGGITGFPSRMEGEGLYRACRDGALSLA